MSFDPVKVVQAINAGLSAVCATCDHFWRGYERKQSCGQDCGGPISGRTFDKYSGPMVDFSLFCFVCSNKSTHGIKVDNNQKVIGCCAEHVDFVKKLKPVHKNAINLIVISKDGTRSTDEMANDKDPIILKIRNTSGST